LTLPFCSCLATSLAVTISWALRTQQLFSVYRILCFKMLTNPGEIWRVILRWGLEGLSCHLGGRTVCETYHPISCLEGCEVATPWTCVLFMLSNDLFLQAEWIKMNLMKEGRKAVLNCWIIHSLVPATIWQYLLRRLRHFLLLMGTEVVDINTG
jgi:hypothetical protein